MRKNLVNTRNNKNLTQVETAKLISITVRHYKALEAGTSDGSMKVWVKLSELFGKTIDYLLEQTDEM